MIELEIDEELIWQYERYEGDESYALRLAFHVYEQYQKEMAEKVSTGEKNMDSLQ